MTEPDGRRFTRRQVLLGGAVVVGAAGAAAVELVASDVLPGRQLLNRVTGACSVGAPALAVPEPGTSSSGDFASKARNRSVGYTIGYPPGYQPGEPLPLVVVLHGHGGDHTSALSRLTLADAAAMQVDGRPLPRVALVAVDGGDGYWHAHPGDDPMAMLVDELIPLCRGQALGGPPARPIGIVGTSMGGYGALLSGQRYPQMVGGVAAISPAIWTTYKEAKAANREAFSSDTDFAAHDVIAHADQLQAAVRVSCGRSDPFQGGVQALAGALPAGATVDISKGCHTASFFAATQPASLKFVAEHVAAP